MNREDAVEAGDLEDLGDVVVGADEHQGVVRGAQALDASYQHAERGGIDEGGLREVYDDLLLPGLDQLTIRSLNSGAV